MKVRDVFFHEIYKKTKHGEDIVIVSSDIGAPSLDDYRRDFPNRFINVGTVSYTNMTLPTTPYV